MYITLDVSDHHYDDNNEYEKKVPSNLPKPDFMPTKLVRTSDMAIVKGSDVNEGYCALSYSWNQSGEISHDEATGKYMRIDEGKHRIISYFNVMHPGMIIPEYETFFNDKLKKMYTVLWIMHCNTIIDEIEYVNFEGIIQKICQQFNIKYVWYDQMCINQKDKKEKHREIRNMHYIYSNAFCTIAFVPECKNINNNCGIGENNEEYFKRLWTLEEALKSKRLLIVGRDLHCWHKDIYPIMATSVFCKQLSEMNVAHILHHAHQRTSTKDHDRVFALIHLFPEFMQHIDIDYDQPLEELMIRFYTLLAKKDLSILLFGNTNDDYVSTIQKYKFLPSWTGVNGNHITDDVTTSFRNYDIIGKTMRVTSKFVTNDQPIDNDALTIRKEDLPPPPGDINDFGNEGCYRLCISVQLPESGETINVSLLYSFYGIVVKEECFDGISKNLKRLSRFVETKKENLYWCHTGREEYPKVIKIDFNHLTEDMDDLSAQYIILCEIPFKGEYDLFYFPVIKKRQGEERYIAIGCSHIYPSIEDYFFNCKLPRQTFLIQ